MIRVELIRAWPRRSEAVTVELADGSSVEHALAASGWSLDQQHTGLCIFGISAMQATPLHDGDRIELLRGLQLDPKQARRLRAQRSGKLTPP